MCIKRGIERHTHAHAHMHAACTHAYLRTCNKRHTMRTPSNHLCPWHPWHLLHQYHIVSTHIQSTAKWSGLCSDIVQLKVISGMPCNIIYITWTSPFSFACEYLPSLVLHLAEVVLWVAFLLPFVVPLQSVEESWSID